MKPKLILGLALVLSGGLLGCSAVHQTNRYGAGWEWKNTSLQKVKFTEAELIGTYRMPIFSDRYVWLGRNGNFFTHFNENFDAGGTWSLQEGVLIVAFIVPTKINGAANYVFFRSLKMSGPGVTFYNGLKFERHSIALQWMQSLPRDVPKKLGDSESMDWFVRDSHTNSVFINNCSTNSLQNEIPTQAEIRAMLFALDTKKGEAFLSLGRTPFTYIQTSGDSKVGYELEYQDDNDNCRAKGRFTIDEVIKVLVSYLNSSDDWKKNFNWKKLKWE
jgi:hypothetical protein